MNQEFLTYLRRLSKQDKKTLSQKALKVAEEVGELARVVLPYENAPATTHRFVEKERILEEVADVLLTAVSIAHDLDFTDEELTEMVIRKAEKWDRLQHNEADIVYPIPFEIHVTVRLGVDSKLLHTNLDKFKQACQHIGVKPIVLDLQNQNGISIMDDVMTSSKHFGTNASAYNESRRIARELEHYGYEVVRVKVETVPWHPAAPREKQPMPKHCYFEAHIPIVLGADDDISKESLSRLDLHLSQNVFKRTEDGDSIYMATYRKYDMSAGEFEANVKLLVGALTVSGYNVSEPHVEFAIYDTKESHDISWIESR